MRKLDFISEGPNLSIFQEDSNKNNFGGFLYLIHIIILLLLAVIYISDYAGKDKYEFNYTYIKEKFNESEIIEGFEEENEHLNYEIECKFQIGKDKDYLFDDNSNFRIFISNVTINNTHRIFYYIRNNEKVLVNTNNFMLAVTYKCDNIHNCTIKEEDKIKLRSYFLNIYYKGFYLDHQNPENPVQKSDEYILKRIEFNENTNIAFLNWELIEYEEDKGIFFNTFDRIRGKENIFYGGDFKSMENFVDDGRVRFMLQNQEINQEIILLFLEIHPNHLQHDKYTRNQVSFLNVLADISALSSTILDLISLVYGFLYSQNYDNYKIVESILTKKMRIKIDNKIEEKEEIKIELKNNLIENDSQSEEKEKIDEENNYNEDKDNKKGSISLPFMRFYDFLIHELYFKCCGHSKKQSLIDSCNDIVAKYTTIENLIYNQIRLENLLNDYKWNNQQHEYQVKNGFIQELQDK